MSITAVTAGSIRPGEAATLADRRADLAQDLVDFAAWAVVHLDAEIPDQLTYQMPVPPGLDHEGRRAWLRRVARSWPSGMIPDGHGGETAEKRVGRVRLVVSVAASDTTTSGFLGQMAAARANGKAAA